MKPTKKKPVRVYRKPEPIRNVVVISDTHVGAIGSLVHKNGAIHGEHGKHVPTGTALKISLHYEYFSCQWLREKIGREPFILVHNGDGIDGGPHHDNVYQWTNIIEEQIEHAVKVLKPLRKRAARYYHVKGTEAHVGKSCSYEEALAKDLGAIPDEFGNHARWQLRLEVSDKLFDFQHHMGGQIKNELIRSYTDAAQWQRRPPDVIVRSHVHNIDAHEIPTINGGAVGVVTCSWQLPTPNTRRMTGPRTSTPQIGGTLIRVIDGKVIVNHCVYPVEPPKVEKPHAN